MAFNIKTGKQDDDITIVDTGVTVNASTTNAGTSVFGIKSDDGRDSIFVRSETAASVNAGKDDDTVAAFSFDTASIDGDKGADSIFAARFDVASIDAGQDNDSVFVHSFSFGSVEGGKGDDTI